MKLLDRLLIFYKRMPSLLYARSLPNPTRWPSLPLLPSLLSIDKCHCQQHMPIIPHCLPSQAIPTRLQLYQPQPQLPTRKDDGCKRRPLHTFRMLSSLFYEVRPVAERLTRPARRPCLLQKFCSRISVSLQVILPGEPTEYATSGM
jgi:hypothetical protein